MPCHTMPTAHTEKKVSETNHIRTNPKIAIIITTADPSHREAHLQEGDTPPSHGGQWESADRQGPYRADQASAGILQLRAEAWGS